MEWVYLCPVKYCKCTGYKTQKISPVGASPLKLGSEGKGQGSAGLPGLMELFPALKCISVIMLGTDG